MKIEREPPCPSRPPLPRQESLQRERGWPNRARAPPALWPFVLACALSTFTLVGDRPPTDPVQVNCSAAAGLTIHASACASISGRCRGRDSPARAPWPNQNCHERRSLTSPLPAPRCACCYAGLRTCGRVGLRGGLPRRTAGLRGCGRRRTTRLGRIGLNTRLVRPAGRAAAAGRAVETVLGRRRRD